MVKVGFICEGQTEEIILKSEKFQKLLKKLNLVFVKSINVKGNGQLLPKNILGYSKQLKGAWKIFILTDSDKVSVEKVYERIKPDPKLHILVVAVKKIESWFLSNNDALQKIAGITYSDYIQQVKSSKPLPSNVEELGNPFDQLKNIMTENIKVRALDKLDVANMFINNDFDIQKSDCESAQFFIKKLEEIASLN